MVESEARTSRKGTKRRGMGIYMKNIITRKVTLPFRILGSNITETIQNKLSQMIEGHCEKEGYIKPASTSIVNYSAGCLNSENVSFIVCFECLVCRPVEGMRFRAVIKNITKGTKSRLLFALQYTRLRNTNLTYFNNFNWMAFTYLSWKKIYSFF